MAAREDQAQPVVHERHGIVCLTGIERRERRVPGECRTSGTRLAPQLLGLLDEAAPPADPVDRAIASGGRDPRSGIARHALLRPRFECPDERLLDGLLGEIEVAEDANERRDRPPGFLPEQAVDELVRLG
jgi:hypothetical protein